MTAPHSSNLVVEFPEKLAPISIRNRLCQLPILEHVEYLVNEAIFFLGSVCFLCSVSV